MYVQSLYCTQAYVRTHAHTHTHACTHAHITRTHAHTRTHLVTTCTRVKADVIKLKWFHAQRALCGGGSTPLVQHCACTYMCPPTSHQSSSMPQRRPNDDINPSTVCLKTFNEYRPEWLGRSVTRTYVRTGEGSWKLQKRLN